MTKVLLPLADGAEEIEVVVLVDVWRRAGWQVTVAGLSGMDMVTTSREMKLFPDIEWKDVDIADYDVLALPGGNGGTQRLCANENVLSALRKFDEQKRWIAAICAAPLVLHRAGVLTGRKFTCYPGVEANIGSSERIGTEQVVVDGHIVTSQGPGTTFELALKLIELIDGAPAANEIADGLIFHHR